MSEEININDANFSEYFHDIRMYKPERGEVMAVYTAIAELIEGTLKRDLIYLLSCTSKVKESLILLRKIGWATEEDAIRVCREMTQDLKKGMSAVEVEAKPYEYKIQMFYYAKKEHIPKDDAHWSFMEVHNLDEHLEKVEHNRGGVIKSRIKNAEDD